MLSLTAIIAWLTANIPALIVGVVAVVGAVVAQMAGGFGKLIEALSPLVRGFSDAVVWLVKDVLYEGGKDGLDDLRTITFIVAACAVAAWWGHHTAVNTQTASCNKVVAELRKDYRLVKRSPAEKRVYINKVDPPQWWEFWR